jgi:undecaprenyl-diphosphatase
MQWALREIRIAVRHVRADAVMMLALLVAVACGWVFILVAAEVAHERTQKVDERVILFLREAASPGTPRGPVWLKGTMRDFTALGSPAILVTFVLVVTGALLVRRQYHALLLVLAATIGGRLLNVVLKDWFQRPRPPLALQLTDVSTPSFPSGHAMDSAVIYFTLAALLARFLRPRGIRLYFLGVAAFLTFCAGVSRVYLGVHYPSDVLAGWTAGLCWACLCWLVANHLQRRGTVEPAK